MNVYSQLLFSFRRKPSQTRAPHVKNLITAYTECSALGAVSELRIQFLFLPKRSQQDVASELNVLFLIIGVGLCNASWR